MSDSLKQALAELKSHRERKADLVRQTLNDNPAVKTASEIKPSAPKAAEEFMRTLDEAELRAALAWIKDVAMSPEQQTIQRLVTGALAWVVEHDYKQLKLW